MIKKGKKRLKKEGRKFKKIKIQKQRPNSPLKNCNFKIKLKLYKEVSFAYFLVFLVGLGKLEKTVFREEKFRILGGISHTSISFGSFHFLGF